MTSSVQIGATILILAICLIIVTCFVFCLWLVCKQSKQLWFVRRGVSLITSQLICQIICIVFGTLMELCEIGTLNASIEFHELLALSWALVGSLAATILLARVFLQLVNNIRAQISDDWSKQQTFSSLKYYYIVGNQKILLAITIGMWLIEFLAICIVLLSGNNDSQNQFFENYTRRAWVIISMLLIFYLLKTVLVGYEAKTLFELREKDGSSEFEYFNSWYIWSEIKLILITMLVSIFLCGISVMIDVLIFVDNYHIVRITYIMGSLFGLLSSYTQSFWVNKVNSKENDKMAQIADKLQQQHQQHIEKLRSQENGQSNYVAARLTVGDVVTNKQGET